MRIIRGVLLSFLVVFYACRMGEPREDPKVYSDVNIEQSRSSSSKVEISQAGLKWVGAAQLKSALMGKQSAEELWRLARVHFRDSHYILKKLVAIYLERGDAQRAAVTLEALLTGEPEGRKPFLYRTLGNVRLRQGFFEMAHHAFSEGFSLASDKESWREKLIVSASGWMGAQDFLEYFDDFNIATLGPMAQLRIVSFLYERGYEQRVTPVLNQLLSDYSDNLAVILGGIGVGAQLDEVETPLCKILLGQELMWREPRVSSYLLMECFEHHFFRRYLNDWWLHVDIAFRAKVLSILVKRGAYKIARTLYEVTNLEGRIVELSHFAPMIFLGLRDYERCIEYAQSSKKKAIQALGPVLRCAQLGRKSVFWEVYKQFKKPKRGDTSKWKVIMGELVKGFSYDDFKVVVRELELENQVAPKVLAWSRRYAAKFNGDYEKLHELLLSFEKGEAWKSNEYFVAKGGASLLLGEKEVGLGYLRKAYIGSPNSPLVLNSIGSALVEYSGAPMTGVPYLKRALLLTHGDPRVQDSLGWAYLKLGMLKQAERHLQKAYDALSYEPEVVYHWAVLSLEKGGLSEGKHLLTEALKLRPSALILRKIRAQLSALMVKG